MTSRTKTIEMTEMDGLIHGRVIDVYREIAKDIIAKQISRGNDGINSVVKDKKKQKSRSASYDYLIKVLMIGDSGAGKSSLLLRGCDDSFTTSVISTVGIDFKIKTIEVEDKIAKLQVWDTAGQERFRTIQTSYYRGAMGILLVYDITDEQSFLNIRNWMRNVEQHASNSVDLTIVGNKCDLEEDRLISKERGQALADEYGTKFFETSAKTDYCSIDIPPPQPNVKSDCCNCVLL
eukprot:3937_1